MKALIATIAMFLTHAANANVYAYACADYDPSPLPQHLDLMSVGVSSLPTDYLQVSKARIAVRRLEPAPTHTTPFGAWVQMHVNGTVFWPYYYSQGCPDDGYYVWLPMMEADYVNPSKPNEVLMYEAVSGVFDCSL